MTEPLPDYVVVRAHPDLPEGFLPADQEGKWYDAREFGPPPTEAQLAAFAERGGAYSEAVAVPTDRFEVRDDGAVAQVWEVRP